MRASKYCSVFLLPSILCIAIPTLLLLEHSTTTLIHHTSTAMNGEDNRRQFFLASVALRDQFDSALAKRTFSLKNDSHRTKNASVNIKPWNLADLEFNDSLLTISENMRHDQSVLRKNRSMAPLRLSGRMRSGMRKRYQYMKNKTMATMSNQSVLSVAEMNQKRKEFVDQLIARLDSLDITLPPGCTDLLCTEYLVPYGWKEFNRCFQRSVRRNHQKLPPVDRCHFMNGTNRAPVALVSQPGSGNTWVRGLLEKATGICTGAVFCDCGLRNGGFSGEGVMSGATLVVKTHSVGPSWTKKEAVEFNVMGRQKFGSAILVIRNPADAIVAEWNRRKVHEIINITNSSHIAYVGREYFGSNPDWNKFVEHQAVLWRFYFNWVLRSNNEHPTLVVRYEDIKANTVLEVQRMLTFLGVPFTDEELRGRLAEGFNQFHRHHSEDEQFEHYTDSQRDRLKKMIQQTHSSLHMFNEQTFNIDEYFH